MGKYVSAGIPITHPMPLAPDNNLPGIPVQIGNLQNSLSASQIFLALINSCAGMNIGNL